MAVNILLYCGDRYASEELRLLLSEDAKTFTVFHFSDENKALDYLHAHGDRIRCVLADSAFLRRAPAAPVSICLSDESFLGGEPYALGIYQSRERVRADLDDILRTAGLLAGARRNESACRTVSFFSTQGGAGRTTLSYLTAVKAAESGRTAWLTLESAPCTDLLYTASGSVGVEDFLVALQDRASAKTVLSALYRNEHGVYVLPVPVSMEDRLALTCDDIDYLLHCLMDEAGLNCLVIDLGSTLTAIERLVMERSDRVAAVYSDDRMGESKRRCLEQDPNYTTYPFVGKELCVGNRCRKEYRDGRFDVCFPVSNSLATVSDVQAVLAGNPAFVAGCSAILAF